MQSIPKNELLTFHEDTLASLRKEYDLDKSGRMDQAIDALVEWLKKQDHFVRKDFERDYLERLIIFGKGSVERAKTKLEKSCAMRSLMPTLYKTIDFKVDYKESNIIIDAALPKLTDDHYRIYVLKNIGKRFDNGFINFFRFGIAMAEYLMRYDYCKGFIVIADYSEANILEIIKNLDMVELHQTISLLIKGFGMRVKGIHMITPSRSVETLVTLFKQVLTAKIADRVKVHKSIESVYSFVQKDILPSDMGGNERPLLELHEQWVNILNSKEYQEYYKTVKESTTNEKYRSTDKFNAEYMGMAGTFRTLSVD